MPKQVAFDEEARKGLRSGAELLSKAVRVTLGPAGRNVILQKSYGAPTITKDGHSVAKEIDLPDPYENIGAQLLRTAAAKTNDDAGDGTTTAVTLGYSLLREGLKSVAAGANPMALKRGLDLAGATVAEWLEANSEPSDERAQYERVARVSANHDEEIGKLVSDALEAVGNEGVVTIEEGRTSEMMLEVVEGMQFDKGFISARFSNTDDGLECHLDDPYILIHQSKLSSVDDIVPILEKTSQVGRPLLIIAEDVDGEALSTLVVNSMRGTIRVCAVKAPGFGDRRKEMLRDIAVLTGGQLIAEELGIRLENVVLGMLGQAERVIVDKDNTILVRGRGSKADVDGRRDQLRRQIDDSTSDYDSEKLQERLARLSGGVAVIYAGAATEMEMKEKKARVEDALSATKAAIEEGVHAGGGVAMLRARQAVDELTSRYADAGSRSGSDLEDELTGMRILRRALAEPIRQIAANAGAEPAVVEAYVAEQADAIGYNALTHEYEDMVEAGIVDPTKVLRSALQSAVSVAGTLLTTQAAIADIPHDDAGSAHAGGPPGHAGHFH
jgi:chaperonin GroEL